MPKNVVQFWAYSDCDTADRWYRITLHEGGLHEVITSGGKNEEGYSYTNDDYWFEDEYVYLESNTQALDCDGRLDTHSLVRCHYSKMNTREYLGDRGILLPEWEQVEQSQRDHEAEKAGY